MNSGRERQDGWAPTSAAPTTEYIGTAKTPCSVSHANDVGHLECDMRISQSHFLPEGVMKAALESLVMTNTQLRTEIEQLRSEMEQKDKLFAMVRQGLKSMVDNLEHQLREDQEARDSERRMWAARVSLLEHELQATRITHAIASNAYIPSSNAPGSPSETSLEATAMTESLMERPCPLGDSALSEMQLNVSEGAPAVVPQALLPLQLLSHGHGDLPANTSLECAASKLACPTPNKSQLTAHRCLSQPPAQLPGTHTLAGTVAYSPPEISPSLLQHLVPSPPQSSTSLSYSPSSACESTPAPYRCSTPDNEGSPSELDAQAVVRWLPFTAFTSGMEGASAPNGSPICGHGQCTYPCRNSVSFHLPASQPEMASEKPCDQSATTRSSSPPLGRPPTGLSARPFKTPTSPHSNSVPRSFASNFSTCHSDELQAYAQALQQIIKDISLPPSHTAPQHLLAPRLEHEDNRVLQHNVSPVASTYLTSKPSPSTPTVPIPDNTETVPTGVSQAEQIQILRLLEKLRQAESTTQRRAKSPSPASPKTRQRPPSTPRCNGAKPKAKPKPKPAR